MVNIITLDSGKKYMLDVGFGTTGPTHPLPLISGNVSQNISPGEVRLVYENIGQNSDPNQKLWIYQHRNDPEADWVAQYCFTELEFLPRDYEMMNFWTSRSPSSWFTYRIVTVRMDMENKQVVGTVALSDGELKRRVGGVTEHFAVYETEDERVEALKTWFGIELGQDERAGIKGLVTELKG